MSGSQNLFCQWESKYKIFPKSYGVSIALHPGPFREPFGKLQAKALRASCAADRAALAPSSVKTPKTSAATDGREETLA